MARLLDQPIKQRPSKSEAAGNALTKLRLNGSLLIPEAAAYLGIHKYTLKEFVDKGLIDVIQIGTRRYVTEHELERVKALIGKFGSLAKAWRSINNPNSTFTSDGIGD